MNKILKNTLLLNTLLIGIISNSFAEIIPLSKSKCLQDYLELFKNDTINMTVAYGYDEVSTAETNDSQNLSDFIKMMTASCKTKDQKTCGFTVHKTMPFILKRKILGPDGRPRTLVINADSPSLTQDNNVNKKSPAQTTRSKSVEEMFYRGLEKDDVTIYLGHSRDGAGPDFSPAKRKADGHVDYDWYHQHPENKNRVFEVLRKNPQKPRILSFLSCSSIRWFSKGIANAAPSSGVIGTDESYWTLTFSEVIPLIESIFSYQCLGQLSISDMHKKSKISVSSSWKIPKDDKKITTNQMENRVLGNLAKLLRSQNDKDIQEDAYFELIQFDKKNLPIDVIKEIDDYKANIKINQILNRSK